MTEKYVPSQEEMSKAEEMMTEEQKVRSSAREEGYLLAKEKPEKKWRERAWQMMQMSGEGSGEEFKEVFDSETELEPLRCLVYRRSDDTLVFHFFSNDNKDENQKFELIINDKPCTFVTFRRDPQGEPFAEVQIPVDVLKELAPGALKPIFRLRRSE